MEKKGKVYNKDKYFLISKRELRRLARYSWKDFRWELIKTLTWNMLREHTENQWKLAEEGKYYAIEVVEYVKNLLDEREAKAFNEGVKEMEDSEQIQADWDIEELGNIVDKIVKKLSKLTTK